MLVTLPHCLVSIQFSSLHYSTCSRCNAKLSKSLSVCTFNTKRHEPQRDIYFFKLVVPCIVNTQKKYVNTEQKSITIDYLRAVKGPGITITNAFAQFCILTLGMFGLGYVYNSC